MIHSSFTSYHVALKLAQSKQIYAFSQISWKSGTVTSPATSYTYSLYLWSWNSPSTSLCMFSLSCTQTPGLTGHHFVLGLTLYFFHGTIANEVDLKPPGHLCNDREVVKITKMNVLHWSVVLIQVLSSSTPPRPALWPSYFLTLELSLPDIQLWLKWLDISLNVSSVHVLVLAVMDQGHQKTCFGSWMHCRHSSETYTGQKKSLPSTWRADSNSCPVTWSSHV